MFTIAIDKRIPVPSRTPGDRSKYPWFAMKVGESFYVPGKRVEGFSAQAVNASKRFGRKYTCRTENGGVRVWRIE